MKPTREVVQAASWAFDAYTEFQTFGKPNSGGLEDQDAEWVEAIEAVKHAYAKAERELEREEAARQEKAANKKR